MLFGRGYMYLEYMLNRNGTITGIGQITWLEIVISSGILAGVAYPYFLYVVYKQATIKMHNNITNYRIPMLIIFSTILILGCTIHYIDKLPRIIILYFTISAWISSYSYEMKMKHLLKNG